MKKWMDELLTLLATGQPIGHKLVQIALEGYTTQFSRDGESPLMLISIYKYDVMGAKTHLTQAIDVQIVLDAFQF